MHKIEKKISKLERYLNLLESFKKDCKSRFLNDPIFEGALLHYLYLVSDGCIVLAQMILKRKDLDNPQSYFDAIDTLGEKGVLPKEFAYEFAKIVSFRNFLAHDYENIDYLIICEDALSKLDDIKLFLKYIKEDLDI